MFVPSLQYFLDRLQTAEGDTQERLKIGLGYL